MPIQHNGVVIDPRLLAVAQLFPLENGKKLSNATGFFFLRDNFLYLVTNRHVVIGKSNPDALSVQVHSDRDDLTQYGELVVPLRNPDGTRRWFEHPVRGSAVDVVAVPVDDPTALDRYAVETFTPDDLGHEGAGLPLGQPLLIVGYPLGFGDQLHRLPIARAAVMASVYPLNFQGETQFVTDGRLHRGASGSPVLTRMPDATGAVRWRLLGIHASSVDMSTRDPTQDDRLGLNLAWYASNLEAITRRAD